MKKIAIAFAVCLLAGGAAFAHHSHASFDVNNEVTIEGTVTQVLWTNPHSLLFLDAKVAGDSTMKRWVVEAPSPNGLTRAGWTRELIKVGDKISASGSPSRSGQPMILVRQVVTAEGKNFSVRPD